MSASLQRKVLDPNDFDNTVELARALNEFERRYNQIAKPFDWNFTRQDLAELLERLDQRQRDPPLASPPDRDGTCGPLSARVWRGSGLG